MKIIKQYQNGYVDVLAQKPVEALFEKGDYIEVDYQDYEIFDYEIVDGKHIYQCRKV